MDDVAVVGAGPAGAWAAYRLARAGARVVLFDHSHPREKPCGGGVTARAWQRVVEALDGCACPVVSIDAAVFQTDDGHPARVPLSSPQHGLVVASRREFDGALLRAAMEAGATLVPERVVDVQRHGTEFLVVTARRARRVAWLLGADGANSLIRRRLLTPFSRRQLSIATGYFAHGPTTQEVIIHFTADPPGYLWSFPRSNHLAIGVCAPADCARVDALRFQTARWLRSIGLAADAPLTPYAWPIPTLSTADLDRAHPAGHGWMLLGDAAGLVDPITREGIFYALESAELAATALTTDRVHASDSYVQSLQETIYPELRRAARLKAGFFRRGFTRLLIEALHRSGRIRDVMADLVSGRQPYRGLTRRLCATYDIGLAWRLLLLEQDP